MTLHGADQLRARLRAIEQTGAELADQWATESVDGIREQVPVVTGHTRSSVRAESVTNDGARVVGAPAVIYLAKGTRAHPEQPRNAQAMHWQTGGRSIFSKRVQHPATQGNPRILQAASDALHGFRSIVYRLWNGAA